MWLFYYFNFEMNYDDLKSKSTCILLTENINFDKNETKSIMENSTYSFRETNMWLSSYKSRKLKVKLWWIGARERKQIYAFFLRFVFFFNVLGIEYTFRKYIILKNKKYYFMHFCCLILKSLKAFSMSLSANACNFKV